jgi:CheY-like chemotaxis protein
VPWWHDDRSCAVHGHERIRVLIADDDPEVLDDVTSSLEALGATVAPAVSGSDLITHLGEDPPYDLVITDISMPWMTGLQAVHSTRYAGLATPVIVMTGLRDPEIPSRVEALGRQVALLHKPLTFEQLKRAVDSVAY